MKNFSESKILPLLLIVATLHSFYLYYGIFLFFKMLVVVAVDKIGVDVSLSIFFSLLAIFLWQAGSFCGKYHNVLRTTAKRK